MTIAGLVIAWDDHPSRMIQTLDCAVCIYTGCFTLNELESDDKIAFLFKNVTVFSHQILHSNC